MAVKEEPDLPHGSIAFSSAGAKILGVRETLEYMEVAVNTIIAELAVETDSHTEQQVTGAGDEDGGREVGEVTIDGRDERVLEVMAIAIQLCY